MSALAARITYNIADAATATGVSVRTLRRAIDKTVTDGAFPPPLRGAKRAGDAANAPILIPADALAAWVDALKDL